MTHKTRKTLTEDLESVLESLAQRISYRTRGAYTTNERIQREKQQKLAGDVVSLYEDKISRHFWKLGRVKKNLSLDEMGKGDQPR